jgi:hypothetical protein
MAEPSSSNLIIFITYTEEPIHKAHMCVGSYSPYFCKEKKISLLNTDTASLLLLWFKNKHWGAQCLWFPFSKAALTGLISIVQNWTFYKEIAVVYLLSFCPIRSRLLPWKLLRFTIIWHCCSYWSAQGVLCQITLKW